MDRHTDRLTLIQLPNPVPDIQSITPVTVLRGSQGTQVSIQGSGFIKTSTVTLQPSPATFPVTFVDNHNLTATLPAGFFTQAGTYQVTVDNPAPDGGPSNTRTFQVENPIPTLTALDPASAQAGGPGMTVKLYGTGFFPETTCAINGQARSCTYVSGSELELPLGPADLASAGDLELKAINPGPGGGSSNPMTFTVTAINPIPVLSALSPNVIKAGSPGFTLTLTGSDFISISSVLFNNTPVSGTLVDRDVGSETTCFFPPDVFNLFKSSGSKMIFLPAFGLNEAGWVRRASPGASFIGDLVHAFVGHLLDLDLVGWAQALSCPPFLHSPNLYSEDLSVVPPHCSG